MKKQTTLRTKIMVLVSIAIIPIGVIWLSIFLSFETPVTVFFCIVALLGIGAVIYREVKNEKEKTKKIAH